MREIYLDNCATTKVDEPVAALAADMMLREYGNPSSLHKKGIDADLALEGARRQVAGALGARPDEVYFTSGGTEANNLGLFGAAKAKLHSGKTLVTTAWEHSSVLAPMRELEKQGWTLKLVAPEPDGSIDISKIADAVDDNTALVSCMLVNSEVGGIADLAQLAKLVRRKNPNTLIHCDAVQGFGKLEFSASKLGVDLLSVSGHKIHAPKGVGALYVKKGTRIVPLVYGGGQERDIRPGTQPMPLIAAFGLAAESAAQNLNNNLAITRQLHEHFVKKAAGIPGLCMNSPPDSTPYLCNLSIPGYRSEILLHYLAARGVYVSSGSACSSGKKSHVLAAMKLPQNRVDSAIRVSFCKYNTVSDVDIFFEVLLQAMKEIAA